MWQRRTWLAGSIILLAVVAAIALVARSGRYMAGPAPSVGPILNECVEEVPEPRDRKLIGIGEEVKLWLESFQDTDRFVRSFGMQTQVDDAMGDVVWHTSGNATVYPIIGSTTMLTADLLAEGGPTTITAQVHDSNVLGRDEPIVRQITIDILTPSGIQPFEKKDQP